MATARRHHQRDDGGGGGGGGHGDASIARRVVIHLDLDCFYAQVEARRLGVDGTSIPMAVQQWSGLIAVNYPARACGVKRHHTVAEAKKLCPEIVLVHVETLGRDGGDGGDDDDDDGDGDDARDDGDDDDARPPRPLRPLDAAAVAGAKSHDMSMNDWQNRKVSLRRYRAASASIMRVLASACPRVEKASIDEAYLDVTAEVDEITRVGGDALTSAIERGVAESGVVEPPDVLASDVDRRLAVGASVCADVRRAVFEKLGYTVSGGVAHNKVRSIHWFPYDRVGVVNAVP